MSISALTTQTYVTYLTVAGFTQKTSAVTTTYYPRRTQLPRTVTIDTWYNLSSSNTNTSAADGPKTVHKPQCTLPAIVPQCEVSWSTYIVQQLQTEPAWPMEAGAGLYYANYHTTWPPWYSTHQSSDATSTSRIGSALRC
ncbi:hypothetical protein LTR53_018951, partial [Teratosphaeriaceae sp. CCFEE 6253]